MLSVLEAVGTIMAHLDNPIRITNQLEEQTNFNAWDVISDVLQEIIEREREKLCDILDGNMTAPIPETTYDFDEQFTYLTQLVHRKPFSATNKVEFANSADRATYLATVEQVLGDHPFVRDGQMANDVLGAAIVAYAVSNDLLNELYVEEPVGQNEGVVDSHTTVRDTLHSVSRQPFLWRHMRKHLSESGALVEGWYLGYLLSSYWNDPVVAGFRVMISPTEERDMRIISSYLQLMTVRRDATVRVLHQYDYTVWFVIVT